MCGGAENADPAVGVLDDGEDVLALPGQGDGLDEVAGEQRFGLGAQEVGLGSWCETGSSYRCFCIDGGLFGGRLRCGFG
jgi:hypothetical protein